MININVKSVKSGGNYSVSCASNGTVGDLLAKVVAKVGGKTDNIQLVSQGRTLVNGQEHSKQLISSLGIVHGSTIFYIFQVCGGSNKQNR